MRFSTLPLKFRALIKLLSLTLYLSPSLLLASHDELTRFFEHIKPGQKIFFVPRNLDEPREGTVLRINRGLWIFGLWAWEPSVTIRLSRLGADLGASETVTISVAYRYDRARFFAPGVVAGKHTTGFEGYFLTESLHKVAVVLSPNILMSRRTINPVHRGKILGMSYNA
jgi:hypothetical protein